MVARRSFLATPLALSQLQGAQAEPDNRVYAFGDGIPHTSAEYAALLSRLAASGKATEDDYCRGGVIETLETRVASVLGKETAVWVPTGTLANHLAMRLLAGTRRRIILQAESHLYNDCGDCTDTLSGLHTVALAPGRATFTVEDLDHAAYDASTGRVATPFGAMQIETPVRRRRGERFDFAAIQQTTAWARTHNIGLHLDGARLFLESAYSGRPVKEYAALFDTVYVSMYKYFNATAGAVLAGPKALLADLYHTRRMFGGGLHQGWPMAAVALHYLDGFEERFRRAKETSEQVLATLATDANFGIERIPNGTNVFCLRVFGVNAPVYQVRLEAAGIAAPNPGGEWYTLQVNETWLRAPAAEIVERFRHALG